MLAACPAHAAVLAAHAEPGPVAQRGQNLKIHNPAAGCTEGEGPDEQSRAESCLADNGCWWEQGEEGASRSITCTAPEWHNPFYEEQGSGTWLHREMWRWI